MSLCTGVILALHSECLYFQQSLVISGEFAYYAYTFRYLHYWKISCFICSQRNEECEQWWTEAWRERNLNRAESLCMFEAVQNLEKGYDTSVMTWNCHATWLSGGNDDACLTLTIPWKINTCFRLAFLPYNLYAAKHQHIIIKLVTHYMLPMTRKTLTL